MSNLADRIHPAPGFLTVTPLVDPQQAQTIIYKQQFDQYYVKGRVISVGKDKTEGQGGLLPSPATSGQVILYTSNGGYNTYLENGELLEIVGFQQVVATVDEK